MILIVLLVFSISVVDSEVKFPVCLYLHYVAIVWKFNIFILMKLDGEIIDFLTFIPFVASKAKGYYMEQNGQTITLTNE
jgi:hypothetical protein